MKLPPFGAWCEAQLGEEITGSLRLEHAFVLAVCRIEEAARMRSRDPIAAVGNGASATSRHATRSAMTQLQYTNAQSRVIQRLLAGSTGGWLGLLRVYLECRDLTSVETAYVRRQARLFASHEAGMAA
ncbi:MAG TPA: hypothetical protein VHO91_21090 [Rhodopila sp.]|nr:hypothetical protein [Rhodopila sp.]